MTVSKLMIATNVDRHFGSDILFEFLVGQSRNVNLN